MKKHLIGYLLLAIGLTAAIAGARFASDGNGVGYAVLPLGIGFIALAFRMLRPTAEERAARAAGADAEQ